MIPMNVTVCCHDLCSKSSCFGTSMNDHIKNELEKIVKRRRFESLMKKAK